MGDPKGEKYSPTIANPCFLGLSNGMPFDLTDFKCRKLI
jgi:hypothetical protein